MAQGYDREPQTRVARAIVWLVKVVDDLDAGEPLPRLVRAA